MLKVVVQGSQYPSGREIAEDGVLFHHNLHGMSNSIGADLCVDLHRLSAVSMNFPRERRVFLVNEPSHFFPVHAELSQIPHIRKHYQYILSNEIMSLQWPGAEYANVFPLWTNPRGWETTAAKKFGVSAIFSAKRGLPCYELRADIVKRRIFLKIPQHILYQNIFADDSMVVSSHMHDSKDSCFEWMFHFAVENCRSPGYFTEKIADCFATFTVPLYYGDQDIGKRWNEAGIIRLDPARWVEQANALKPEDYTSRLPALVDNYERAKRYWTFERSLLAALREHGCLNFWDRLSPKTRQLSESSQKLQPMSA